VTTLRTHADKEDDFRRVGFSKDRSIDPQIVVGLLVDRYGFPLEIGCFEGNRAEKLTLLTIVGAFKQRHQLADMVVVADAGMLSAANLSALDQAGFGFIVGARATKAPLDLESHFRWHGDAFTDGQVIDTLTAKTGKNTDNNPNLSAEPVWDRDAHPGSWRAVWAYSGKRFVRDNKTLTAQENRARDVIAGVKAAHKPRFVKTTRKGFTLDMASLDRARRLAGLKGWVTNIPATVMPASEVLSSYHDLWHVEQSFRITKTDLGVTPLFARQRQAIEAHLTIAFAALAVARTVQNRTGWTIRRTLRLLRPLRSATIEINGVIQTFPPAIGPQEQTIIDALQHNPPRP
jgi:transposase